MPYTRFEVTAYNTRNLPVDVLRFAKILAKVRGCTLEKMIADALAIGLECWAGTLLKDHIDE